MNKIVLTSMAMAAVLCSNQIKAGEFKAVYIAACRSELNNMAHQESFTASLEDGNVVQTQVGDTPACKKKTIIESFDGLENLECGEFHNNYTVSGGQRNSTVACTINDTGQAISFYMNPSNGFEFVELNNNDKKIDVIRKDLKKHLLRRR